MRVVLVGLVLVACTPTLTFPTGADSSAVVDVAADVDQRDAVDVALDAGATRDVVRVEGGACIPACAAGQTCVDGVCEGDAAVADATDARTVDVWRPARAYQSCEPVGSDCGDGLTCLAVTAGATRGICTVRCEYTGPMTRLGQCPVTECLGGATNCTGGWEECEPMPTGGALCVHGCRGQSACPTNCTCREAAPVTGTRYCAP